MLLGLGLLTAGLVCAVLVYAYSSAMRRRTPTPPPPPRVLAEAVPPPATVSGAVDPLAALDAILAELESATVRLDGADELDDGAVNELEALARRIEAAAAGLVK